MDTYEQTNDRQPYRYRQILHAALIFDPDYVPLDYRIPRPRRPTQTLAISPTESKSDELESGGDQNDDGSDSSPPNSAETPMTSGPSSAEKLEEEHSASDIDRTQLNSSPIQEKVSRNGAKGDGVSKGKLREAIAFNTQGVAPHPSGSVGDKINEPKNPFAVTDEELELLDHDGTRGRRGVDAEYISARPGRWSL